MGEHDRDTCRPIDLALNREAFEIACQKVRRLSNGEPISHAMRNRIAGLVLDDISNGMSDAELIGCHVAHRLAGRIGHPLAPGSIRVPEEKPNVIAKLFGHRSFLRHQR